MWVNHFILHPRLFVLCADFFVYLLLSACFFFFFFCTVRDYCAVCSPSSEFVSIACFSFLFSAAAAGMLP